MKLSIPTLLLFVFSLALNGLQGRTWTSLDGRTLEADYISSTDDRVEVRRSVDQRIFQLQIDQLSPADREFIEEQRIIELGTLHTPDEFEFAHFRPRIDGFKFGGNRVPANYLGVVSLREKTLGVVPYWMDGMSIGKDGEIIMSSGNGTTPHMKLITWTPEAGARDIVPLEYIKSEPGISPEERAKDQQEGRFWFFGGQIAHDRDGDVLFTLGACGGNGIFRVDSANPVRLERLNTCIASSSLQVPPWDNRYAYIARGEDIRKFKISRNSADEDDVVFTINGDKIYLGNCLMLDEDRLIAGISLPTEEVDERGIKISGKFGILIDRKADGYYLLSDGLLGAMALNPETGQLLRVAIADERKYEVREFEIVKGS
ncbi:hypothetical protein [Cerasicoccus fimbriatus]|uniref:hypothetical protein n=1 Tax=Cerasicoccus fimbriatus TaxID=3014554 RepID=UPI0022B5B7C5|nr:hypothetical protein [Cerasicoccus sp. TK19100]